MLKYVSHFSSWQVFISTCSGLKETAEAQMAQASFKCALSDCHVRHHSGNVGGKGIGKAAKALTG